MTNAQFQQTVLEQFKTIDGRFVRLEQRFDGLEQRFSGVESTLTTHSEQFDLLAIHVQRIDEKLDQCATKHELAGFRSEVLTTMDRFAQKYDQVEIEVVAGVHRDDMLDKRVTALETQRA